MAGAQVELFECQVGGKLGELRALSKLRCFWGSEVYGLGFVCLGIQGLGV